MVCPICGAQAVTHEADYPSAASPFVGWPTRFCSACGSGYVPGAAALLGDYYSQSYAKDFAKNRFLAPKKYFDKDKPGLPDLSIKRMKSQIKALRDQGAKFDRVLDFGSGPGYFLYLSQPKAAFAVELDEMAAKYLAFIDATRLTEDDVRQNTFDTIVSSHVFEHFTDDDVLDKMSMLLGALSPNGRLLIEVPQGGHSYLYPRGKNEPHTIFFTAEGLRHLVTRAGGTVLAAYARAAGAQIPERPDAIYHPDRGDSFAATTGGGLTVIAGRGPS